MIRLLHAVTLAREQRRVDARHPLFVERHLHDDEPANRIPQIAHQPRMGADPPGPPGLLDEVLQLGPRPGRSAPRTQPPGRGCAARASPPARRAGRGPGCGRGRFLAQLAAGEPLKEGALLARLEGERGAGAPGRAGRWQGSDPRGGGDRTLDQREPLLAGAGEDILHEEERVARGHAFEGREGRADEQVDFLPCSLPGMRWSRAFTMASSTTRGAGPTAPSPGGCRREHSRGCPRRGGGG